MALKQVRTHHQRSSNQLLSSKQVAPPKKKETEPVGDPWSFLELIDAPQWTDLSLESSLVDIEGHDPWFETFHKYHAISLAGKNVSMKGLLCGKSKSQLKETKLQPKVVLQEVGKRNRPLHTASSFSSSSESQDISQTFSGSSSVSEYGPCRPYNCKSSSERLSVTSNLRVAFIESRKLSSESSLSQQADYDSGTPHNSDQYRAKPLATVHALRTKLRFSLEQHHSNLTSSGVSGVTSTSTASWSSDDQIEKGYSRKSEVSSELRTVNEGLSEYTGSGQHSDFGYNTGTNPQRKSSINCLKTAKTNSEASKGDLRFTRCKTLRKFAINCQQTVGKCDVTKLDRNTQAQKCQVGLLSRKQQCPGKENEQPYKDLRGQVSNQPNSNAPPMKSLNPKSVAHGIRMGETMNSARHSEGIKHGIKPTMKKTDDKRLVDKSSNSENDLAALVAQHNQKIKMLHVHQQRKAFR